MRKLVLLALVTIAFNGDANACTAEGISAAQNIFDRMAKAANAGIASPGDVVQAKLHVLEMMVCASKTAETCKELVSTAQENLKVASVKFSAGISTVGSVITANEKLVQAKANCK